MEWLVKKTLFTFIFYSSAKHVDIKGQVTYAGIRWAHIDMDVLKLFRRPPRVCIAQAWSCYVHYDDVTAQCGNVESSFGERIDDFVFQQSNDERFALQRKGQGQDAEY